MATASGRRAGFGPAALGALCVVASCLTVQLSAAVSSRLFDDLGAVHVAALRQLVAAALLAVLLRPRLRGRTRLAWVRLAAYGAAMATMTEGYYLALRTLPLGVAATLLYLGPFVVSAAGVRRWWEAALPVLGLLGVVLVSRPGGDVAPVGVGFALLAAAALASYTLLAQRIGRDGPGLDSLALALCFSALFLLPFSLPTVPHVSVHQWGVLLLAGGVGVAAAFSLDFVAIQLAGARVVSTFFALDPVAGALVGAVVLGQVLTARAVVGMALIAVAGATVAWVAGGPGAVRTDAPLP